MAPTVIALRTTPVKGLRVVDRERVRLTADGVPDDRRFHLVDARGRMVNAKQVGALSQVVASYREAEGELELRFEDGARVADVVRLGEELATTFFSRPTPVREVGGPFSAALSRHAGRELRLVQALHRAGVDRGRQGAVSLVSRASLDALDALAGGTVDARRFRMLVEVGGLAEPHAEDAWVGARVRLGAALVRVRGHVGRCLVTQRDPDSGADDLATLDLLRSYRAGVQTTEPLAFGVYGEVLEPGEVALGDDVVVG